MKLVDLHGILLKYATQTAPDLVKRSNSNLKPCCKRQDCLRDHISFFICLDLLVYLGPAMLFTILRSFKTF